MVKNYEIITNKLNKLGAWAYERIVKIDYEIEADYEDNYIGSLDISFCVIILETKEPFKIKIRYHNVYDLTLRKATTLPLNDSLVIHDMKKSGLVSSQQYHVHDDSGYGENDGFGFIDFYCSSIEALSVEEFYSS
ncbi:MULTISPECIES: hypothetical protein [Paenibacillus]|uniref:hypothetical protein n=1 Tax=Paenibacillus TaxID=44249 RepID=UPI0020247C6B|nr:hypothetical protein [Paenibacillus polymyxa]URJ61208.1 hypothetical protein MF622_000901 [Paenibacillus polymyxa]